MMSFARGHVLKHGLNALKFPSSGVLLRPFSGLSSTSVQPKHASEVSISKNKVPHYYLTVDVCLDAVVAQGLNVFGSVVKAAAMACKAVPEANACWFGENKTIRQYEQINLLFHQPEGQSMVTDPQTMDVAHLADALKVHREDDGGESTFRIVSSPNVDSVCSIINPKHSCVLGMGSVKDHAMVRNDGKLAASKMCTFNLSCDHRVIDGAVGATWLQHFKKVLEDMK